MTTQVIIKSPRPNHQAVKVEAVNPDTGEPNGYASSVLGDGDSCSLYVHGGSMLRITEAPKSDVPPGARELTFGEKAVGSNFNPSGDANVANCKDEFAAVIDRMNFLRNDPNVSAEVKRMASVAITEAQTAQMWAVKALTWRG